MICNRRVRISVELREGVHELPNPPVTRMEDMGTVFVYVDAVDALGIDIPAGVRAFVDDYTSMAAPPKAVSHHGSEQSGSDDQICIFHSTLPISCSPSFWKICVIIIFLKFSYEYM